MQTNHQTLSTSVQVPGGFGTYLSRSDDLIDNPLVLGRIAIPRRLRLRGTGVSPGHPSGFLRV